MTKQSKENAILYVAFVFLVVLISQTKMYWLWKTLFFSVLTGMFLLFARLFMWLDTLKKEQT